MEQLREVIKTFHSLQYGFSQLAFNPSLENVRYINVFEYDLTDVLGNHAINATEIGFLVERVIARWIYRHAKYFFYRYEDMEYNRYIESSMIPLSSNWPVYDFSVVLKTNSGQLITCFINVKATCKARSSIKICSIQKFVELMKEKESEMVSVLDVMLDIGHSERCKELYGSKDPYARQPVCAVIKEANLYNVFWADSYSNSQGYLYCTFNNHPKFDMSNSGAIIDKYVMDSIIFDDERIFDYLKRYPNIRDMDTFKQKFAKETGVVL